MNVLVFCSVFNIIGFYSDILKKCEDLGKIIHEC